MKTKIIIILLCLFYLLDVQARDKREDTITIAILSVNDFHGSFVRNEKKEIPGAGNLLFVIDSLKSVYPNNIVVSAGDNFGGSYFSNITNGALIPGLFYEAGIRTSALGNHEFDNGQEFLAEKWKDDPARPEGWDLTYVCANVKVTDTDSIPGWTVPMESYTLNISQEIPVKVNFVGLIAESAPKQTAKKNVEGLSFDGNYLNVLDNPEACNAPNGISPSDINILLTHIGTEMNNDSITWSEGEDKAEQQIQKSPLYHGILSAHSHKRVCGFKDRMPIVQGEISGKYICLLEVKYSCPDREVLSVEPKLIDVFRKDWQPSSMDSIVNETIKEKCLDSIVGKAKEDLFHSRYDSQKFTALGSYICLAFEEKYREVANERTDKPVLGFCAFGGIRTDLPEGDVTILDAGEVLPFAEDLIAYNVKGKDIKNFIEYGINNKSKGWLQMNNLKIDYIKDEGSGSSRVVNVHYRGSGQVDVILDDSDEYVVVSIDFLLSGGDGYPNLKEVGKQIEMELKGSTDAFIEFLGNWKEDLREDNPYKARAEEILCGDQ